MITDIVAILSGTTIALGLLNYVATENERNKKEEREKNLNYVNNISSVFNDIDNLYFKNADHLHNLHYEYNSFPISKKIGDKNEITSHEYIAISIIIEYLCYTS